MTGKPYLDALLAGHSLCWDVIAHVNAHVKAHVKAHVNAHVLRQGDFGISCLARDTHLDRRVAVKKYLPSEIARRRSDAEGRLCTAGARPRRKARTADLEGGR